MTEFGSIRYIEPSQRAGMRFMQRGGEFLTGPEDERSDLVMLIHQSSTQSFLAFSNHQDFLASIGHRIAVIEDSRLLPIAELQITN